MKTKNRKTEKSEKTGKHDKDNLSNIIFSKKEKQKHQEQHNNMLRIISQII